MTRQFAKESFKIAVTALALFPDLASAQGAGFAPEQIDFFASDVYPILESNCFECHGGGDKLKGDLYLTSRESMLEGGESGSILELDDPGGSLLLEMLSYEDEFTEMPPDGKLPQRDIDTLTTWVMMGVPWDSKLERERGEENIEMIVDDKAKDFWSFNAVRKVAVPKVDESAWAANLIDAFVYDRLAKNGLRPSGEADRRTLIRRAYYDLTGLPPSVEEVRVFSDDDSPEAYEKIVDRLLASPHYGEKWARHWLDLVRYADSHGYERDSDKPYIWRYRDYVIDAFNEDKPYDEFVKEQLAGDELDEPSPAQIIATGYYRLGLWDDEPADAEQAVFDNLDDIVSTTGQVFLGLTIGCARCHDHKLDPIPQKDYYRFLAFFRNMTEIQRTEGNGILRNIMSKDEQAEYDTKVAMKNRRESALAEQLSRLLESFKTNVAKDDPDWLRAEDGGDIDIDELVKKHGESYLSEEEYAAYRQAERELRKVRSKTFEGKWAAAIAEKGPNAPDTFLLIRGSAHSPGEKVVPAFPQVLSPPEAVLRQPSEEKNTTYRRTVLADWIASDENPLTARVMVNRIWQHHFGRGIVRSSNDFGSLGDRPTHPDLLDWLADAFVDGGWSMKSLHKKIMMSKTYRMSSKGNVEALALDPANDLLWRFDMRRLTAEEIRDSILLATGELNLALAGPTVYPELSKEIIETSSKKGELFSSGMWGKSSLEEQNRRSIYVHLKRSLLYPMLADFDFADIDASCPVRFTTTQPSQALNLLNSAYVNARAKMLLKRVEGEAASEPESHLVRAFELVLGREPTVEEIAMSHAFLDELRANEGLGPQRAMERYCLLVLNLNEFLFVD